ncbi:MAG: MBL fold metallo-hydrolase [Bacteroidales bacterium]|jgi:L-ascorbate metabolism protein UlaG (beta-lactamase superfamily)
MKRIVTCLLALMGIAMAYGQGNYETDVFTTQSGKTIKLHALMHASIRMEYDGKEIEIDPVSKLRDRTVDYTAMPKADYIFVTHEHGDHYDANAIKLLTGEQTKLIMNKRCAEMYGAGEVMVNGDSKQIANDFKVEAVPAYNTSPDKLTKHPKGRDNGYILTIDGFRIYFAGDTEDVPEMDNIKNIDVAYFPCNNPTMNAEQFVRAAKLIKPKVVFPYHYTPADITSIPQLLQGTGIEVRVRNFD